jgi:MFS family permease
MVVVAIAAVVFTFAHDDPLSVLVASALLGVGVGAAFASMAALVAENVDPREMGIAAGMNTVVRMVGAVVGGQVGAALLTARTIGDTSIPAESAYTITFGLSGIAALAAAAIALRIGKTAVLRRLEPAEILSSRRTKAVHPQG